MNCHMKTPGVEDVIFEKMEEIEDRVVSGYQRFEQMGTKVLLNPKWKSIGNHLVT